MPISAPERVKYLPLHIVCQIGKRNAVGRRLERLPLRLVGSALSLGRRQPAVLPGHCCDRRPFRCLDRDAGSVQQERSSRL